MLDYRASDGQIDYLTNGRVTSGSDSDTDSDTIVISQLQDEKTTATIQTQTSPVGL